MILAQLLGKKAEQFAANYLKQKGLKLIERNFRCRHGEIDLIMHEQQQLVFIEVRLRNHEKYVSGAESIDYYKQQRLIHTAQYYLKIKQNSGQICRFDVLDLHQQSGIFKTRWIQNAFEHA